ncbi:DNA-directed RNA polymeras-like protein II subunit rpb9 [Pleomassaria siparia CBS 279.74]|uniref:DNA-directed RNA polymerase subunit n=1 Tax=Pleomassaria siparia CBS 279.74 TaxID=1314801 RepID=A0A6G1KQ90_9PLEO|nr:DNA-directed RNA polymeras-like protein II subunit rpb9 [Pleomassaria siparia CBS 279.74]
MASPVGYEEQKAAADDKKILFRFCSECSNLLFPREDKENNKLLFACRTCSFTEEAPLSCVMRHDIGSSVGETAGITQDVAQDPTLPRIQKSCTACGENEAVFFQSQQRTAETGMKLYYVCCACGYVWQ